MILSLPTSNFSKIYRFTLERLLHRPSGLQCQHNCICGQPTGQQEPDPSCCYLVTSLSTISLLWTSTYDDFTFRMGSIITRHLPHLIYQRSNATNPHDLIVEQSVCHGRPMIITVSSSSSYLHFFSAAIAIYIPNIFLL